jgi:hypothetical protein
VCKWNALEPRSDFSKIAALLSRVLSRNGASKVWGDGRDRLGREHKSPFVQKKDREGAIAPAIVESVPRVGVEVRKASGGYPVEVLAGVKSQSLRGIHVLSNEDNK